MRREALHPHPAMPATAALELSVGIDWGGPLTQNCRLHYRVTGNVAALRIPAPAAPQRTDELWRHTCCELFIAVPGVPGYCEFNFAPSGQWAAYQFDGYRTGMRPLALPSPDITCTVSPSQLDVHVTVMLDSVLLRSTTELSCALSAVIEETAGTRSFWALEHGAPQPDFHHPQSFAVLLHPRE